MSLGIDYLDSLLEDDKEKGIFRCKREMSPTLGCSIWR